MKISHQFFVFFRDHLSGPGWGFDIGFELERAIEK